MLVRCGEELSITTHGIGFLPDHVRDEILSAKFLVKQYLAVVCLVIVQVHP